MSNFLLSILIPYTEDRIEEFGNLSNEFRRQIDFYNLNSDIEVMKYLNREVLVVKNGTNEEYITDSQEISNRMLTESSYLLMKPAFQYPSNDKIKDCGNNELVVVGIGFVLKNWQNGLRNYAIVIGAHAELPNNVFAPPDINICFRYYYNQHES